MPLVGIRDRDKSASDEWVLGKRVGRSVALRRQATGDLRSAGYDGLRVFRDGQGQVAGAARGGVNPGRTLAGDKAGCAQSAIVDLTVQQIRVHQVTNSVDSRWCGAVGEIVRRLAGAEASAFANRGIQFLLLIERPAEIENTDYQHHQQGKRNRKLCQRGSLDGSEQGNQSPGTEMRTTP